MPRINIVCSEKDKGTILRAFEVKCPFNPPVDECGEDTCGECLARHVDFDIAEDEVKKGA